MLVGVAAFRLTESAASSEAAWILAGFVVLALAMWMRNNEKALWEAALVEISGRTEEIRDAAIAPVEALGWELSEDHALWLVAVRRGSTWSPPREVSVVFGDSYLLFNAVVADTGRGRGARPNRNEEMLPEFERALRSVVGVEKEALPTIRS